MFKRNKRNTLKKIGALAAGLTLLTALSLPVFADEEDEDEGKKDVNAKAIVNEAYSTACDYAAIATTVAPLAPPQTGLIAFGVGAVVGATVEYVRELNL